MSGSLNIYPFQDPQGAVRFAVQVIVFLVGLVVTHRLIIKPALKLSDERNKRTQGNVHQAQKNQESAEQLEREYNLKLSQGVEQVKKLRMEKIQEAQRKAAHVVDEAQRNAQELVLKTQKNIDGEAAKAQQELKSHVSHVVDAISKKIGISFGFFLMLTLPFLVHKSVLASESGEVDFWYGVFWPYFQFAFFIAVIVYFAKKPITQMLDDRRNEFKARLSEAREALILADRKMKEYQSKIQLLADEIETLKNQNLFDANIEAQRILQEAQKTSDAILRDANRATQEIIYSNMEKIRQQMFALAMDEISKHIRTDKIGSIEAKLKADAVACIKTLQA